MSAGASIGATLASMPNKGARADAGGGWATIPSGRCLSEVFIPNTMQRGDALALLRSLSNNCSPLVFLDPQHRGVLDCLQFGNEGARQRGRARLPAMSEGYIDEACREIARALAPSGYCMRWIDTFGLCEAHHLRVVDVLKPVDLLAWDNLRIGMGKRTRRRGDYLLILQKPLVKAGSTWRDRSIPSRWAEKVDRNLHPHIKSIGLIERLIGTVTQPGDLVVDPAAGSFVVMHAAHRLDREFIGCDLILPDDDPTNREFRDTDPQLIARSIERSNRGNDPLPGAPSSIITASFPET